MEEVELLKKIKHDPESFRIIFQQFYQPIFGYIYRRTGHFEDTADLAATTFYKAFINLGKFVPRGISIKVWLYRIATNETNLYFRHNRRRTRALAMFEASQASEWKQSLAGDKIAIQAEMEQHRRFQRVQEGLKSLPVRYQQILALRYFEGKPTKEIAEILDKKEGTIKSLLSRGVEKLREKVQLKSGW